MAGQGATSSSESKGAVTFGVCPVAETSTSRGKSNGITWIGWCADGIDMHRDAGDPIPRSMRVLTVLYLIIN